MTKCKTTLSVIFPYLCLLLPRRKDGVGDYLIYELYKIFCKDFATKKNEKKKAKWKKLKKKKKNEEKKWKNLKKIKKKNEKKREKNLKKKWKKNSKKKQILQCTDAWVTRPERPKGVKDVIKQARRAQSRPEGPQPRSRGPEGP